MDILSQYPFVQAPVSLSWCVYTCRSHRCVCDERRAGVRSTSGARLLALVCSHASICFYNPGDWHTSQRWEQGNSALFCHIHQCKERDRANLCGCAQRITQNKRERDGGGGKKKVLTAEGTAASRWMRNLLWRRFKGAILHQLMSKGVNRRMHCLETARCCTRESIYGTTDQGWNDSKLALKNWVLARKQMKWIFR